MISYFFDKPETQPNSWPPNGICHEYGAGALFAAYFYERFGAAALRKLSDEPGRGLEAFDDVLKAMVGPGVDAFADWVLAKLYRIPKSVMGDLDMRWYPQVTKPLATITTPIRERSSNMRPIIMFSPNLKVSQLLILA